MKNRWIIVAIFFTAELSAHAQLLSKEQSAYLKKNVRVVSAASASAPTWDFLAPHLKNKKIILLGEFNHGSKEVFAVRNSLIKYLHEKQGINIILLESGIGELISTDIHKNEMTPEQMTNGLVGPWRTKEFVELMTYVKTEKMSIAGFDVQRSSGSFTYLLKDLGRAKGIDSIYYYDLETRYSSLNGQLSNRRAVYDSLRPKTEKLISDYKAMQAKLAVQATEGSKELQFATVTITNRIAYLNYMLTFVNDKNYNSRWAARDAAMAANVQWLLDNIYKDQRVIVVGHNFHVGKFNEQEVVMGEVLHARYNKAMYTIGFFAGAGSFSDNTGKEQQMVPPDSASLDIKHIISDLKGSVNFIEIAPKKETGRDWLDQPITVNDTFIDLSNTNKMIMSKCFDGLVLIDRVNPPKTGN